MDTLIYINRRKIQKRKKILKLLKTPLKKGIKDLRYISMLKKI